MPMTSAGMQETLANPALQLAVYTSTGRLVDKRKSSIAEDLLPDYQELRDQANALKRHTINNLDWYLEQFEANVQAHGGKVIWCETGEQVADFILNLAKERRPDSSSNPSR